MRAKLIFIFELVFVLMIVFVCFDVSNAQSNEIQTNGRVCHNPSSPCSGFEEHDLSFRLPKNIQWQSNYYSVSFYAVILKSKRAVYDESPMIEARCERGFIPKSEREKAQALFPENKVFASHLGCYSLNNIWYTNADSKYNFLAVYAGETKVEAERFLVQVKNTRQYPDANIRMMKVVFANGD